MKRSRPLHARPPARTARPSGGQAITEFLAGAGLLAALLAGIVVVGRLQDVQWATIHASRYAGFELALRTGRRANTLEGHVRARFFEPPDTPLRTDDVRRSDSRWRRVAPHWTDRSSRAQALVARPADVRLESREAEPPGTSARLANTVAAIADRASVVNGGRFDVNRRGYHAAELSVRIAPLATERPPLSDLALTFRERTVVLGDSWDASGPQQVADRTSAFVPLAPLRALRPVVGALGWALQLFEPAIGSLCLGRIDPELVPLDRLGAPGTGERGSWSARC